MMMSTANLVWELRKLLRAEAEEAAARDDYDGCSWDYHGQSFITATAEAEKKFELALNAVIDARISKSLVAGPNVRANLDPTAGEEA